MKEIKLQNSDFLGYVDKTRHAARGLVINNGKILLGYEQADNQYIIPGGGLEENESIEECCSREILEETGLVCKLVEEFLVIDELFATMRHINHYFICEMIEDTHKLTLTDREKNSNLTFVWKDIKEAIEIFSTYETYAETNVPRFGLYRRELCAIKAYVNKLSNKG